MKHFLVLTFIFCMVSGLLFSLGESDDGVETFKIQENNSIRLSIEYYKLRDLWVPVVLTFGCLEMSLPIKIEDLEAAGEGEPGINEMPLGAVIPMLTIYEDNPVRTRMRLLDGSLPVTVTINRETGQVDFYFGGHRLKLDHNHIRAAFTEIEPAGLYQLTFDGKGVLTYKRLIYEPDTGTIYAVSLHRPLFNLNPEKCTVWAVKVDVVQGEERLFNHGKEGRK